VLATTNRPEHVDPAARAIDQTDIAITRKHFDLALGLLTAAPADGAEQEQARLLLAG
jgi:hypothetical protein